MHHVAVLELDIGDETADPRANLDLFDGLEPAGEFIPVGDGALDRLRHRDRWCRGGGLRRRLFAAAGQCRGEHNSQRPGATAQTEPELRPLNQFLQLQRRAHLHVPCILAAIDRGGRHGGWPKMRPALSLFKTRRRASEIFHAIFAMLYAPGRKTGPVHAARQRSSRIMTRALWRNARRDDGHCPITR